MNLFCKTSSIKGSALIFSLIILAFMLISALSVATVSVTEKRASLSTEKSARSFQMADTGVETILQRIYKVGSFGILCQGSGILADSNTFGSYRVTLYDAADVPVNCNDGNWRGRVAKIKSEGLSGNTIRVVEVAVAAAGDYDVDCAQFPPASEFPFCCQMDTGNGDTQCRFSGGAIWSDFVSKPWNAGSAGDYQISCASGVGAGVGVFCCKNDTSTGSTECRQTTSPGAGWSGMFTSPSVSDPF